MKKNLLFVLIPLVASLVSCGDKGYNIAKFNLNYDGESFSQVVNDDQLLLLPTEPERIDYVFNGWYLDAACTTSFEDFDKPLEEDIELYASWVEYEKLADETKIDRFLDKLDRLTGNVVKSEVIIDGAERYFTPVDQQFGVYQEEEYNRYKDITTVDFFDKDKSNQYGSQQYFYDSTNFYSIYKDIEGKGVQNDKKTAKYDESKIESFLSIDFLNLYCSQIYTLRDDIIENDYADFDYIIELNDTRMNQYDLNYSFKVETYSAVETNMGLYEEMYLIECTLQFINGKINRSRVKESYLIALGAEEQMVAEYNIQTTYTVADEYSDFEGERFDPRNFN